MSKTTKDLLEFWEDQMKLSHMSSNYFFRKSPSHYHMMLLVMHAYKYKENLTVEELKTKLFKTSRPKSALMINEACEKGFFFLEKTSISLFGLFAISSGNPLTKTRKNKQSKKKRNHKKE